MTNTTQRRKPVITPVTELNTKFVGAMPVLTKKIIYHNALIEKLFFTDGKKLMQAVERLGAIYRLAKNDKGAYSKLNDWMNGINLHIATSQLSTVSESRNEVTEAKDVALSDVEFPNKEMTFKTTHSSSTKIIALITAVDSELSSLEQLFLSDGLDDIEFDVAARQCMAIVNGVIDRVFKVTSPGKRENGTFDVKQYVQFLKDPKFDLSAHTDYPVDFQHMKPVLEEPEIEKSKVEPEKSEAPKPVKKTKTAKKKKVKKAELA